MSREIEGVHNSVANKRKCQGIWRDIWSKDIEYKRDFEWLRDLKLRVVCPKPSELDISDREGK